MNYKLSKDNNKNNKNKTKMKENPLFKTSQRIVVAAIDEDEKETVIAEDEYVYFFRTPENVELYDDFRAYTHELLFQI